SRDSREKKQSFAFMWPTYLHDRSLGDSKCFEEVDEVFLLLLGETDAEALVIKVHHVHQRCGRAIVEVWRAGSQAPQDRSLEFTDVVTAARNQGTARVGDFKIPTVVALNGKNRQSGNVETRRRWIDIGDAYIKRQFDRMIADVLRVVARATETDSVLRD